MRSSAIRRLVPALVLVASASLAASCASADGDSSAEARVVRSAISGGEPDSADTSVFLLASRRGSEGVALCSASLIAPNLLITARHCVSDVTAEHVTCGQTMVSAPFPADTLSASNSLTLGSSSTRYRASAVSVPSEGTDICGFDIALITLEAPIPSGVATPLVPRIDAPVVRRESYRAVGYGQTEAGDAGVAGERRGRSGLSVNCAPGKCGQGVESNEFVGETGICSGDSGGPALDESGKVVGVVSRSGTDCAHPVYASVASWKDWLIRVATEAAAQGQYEAPFWAKTGLSDPPGGAAAGTQGDRCTASADCAAGLACYSPTSMASNAYCAALCKEEGDCASGTSCALGLGVCVASPPSPHGSSSCALAASRSDSNAPLLIALAAFGAALTARRRRRGTDFPAY
ncbi:MAG: S1 family peptidase [Myxococcales bacterium]